MPTLNNTKTSILNTAVIHALVEAIVDNDSGFIDSMGIDTDVIDLLKTLPATQLTRLTQSFGAQIIEVRIDGQALSLFKEHIERESQTEDLTDRVMSHGGRFKMINALTGISRQEYEQRRDILGIEAPSRGRIEFLNEADEVAVWDAWELTQENDPALERYLQVSLSTGLPIDKIWQAVQNLVAA